jgi:hypothetical protein
MRNSLARICFYSLRRDVMQTGGPVAHPFVAYVYALAVNERWQCRPGSVIDDQTDLLREHRQMALYTAPACRRPAP